MIEPLSIRCSHRRHTKCDLLAQVVHGFISRADMAKPEKSKTLPSSIRPLSKYTGWLRCLFHLHSELGRTGRKPRAGIKDFQYQLMDELSDGPSESALAELNDWGALNLRKLIERGERYG